LTTNYPSQASHEAHLAFMRQKPCLARFLPVACSPTFMPAIIF